MCCCPFHRRGKCSSRGCTFQPVSSNQSFDDVLTIVLIPEWVGITSLFSTIKEACHVFILAQDKWFDLHLRNRHLLGILIFVLLSFLPNKVFLFFDFFRKAVQDYIKKKKSKRYNCKFGLRLTLFFILVPTWKNLHMFVLPSTASNLRFQKIFFRNLCIEPTLEWLLQCHCGFNGNTNMWLRFAPFYNTSYDSIIEVMMLLLIPILDIVFRFNIAFYFGPSI